MTSFGANLGFVDEMYARYRANPSSVSEAWRDFFADYEPPAGQLPPPGGDGGGPSAPAEVEVEAEAEPRPAGRERLEQRGAGGEGALRPEPGRGPSAAARGAAGLAGRRGVEAEARGPSAPVAGQPPEGAEARARGAEQPQAAETRARRAEQPAAEEARGPALAPAAPAEEGLEPLTGAKGRIVQNMEASLQVPTATSARTIPVKLLEENRRIINQHQSTAGGPKVSFTHVIAWAVVRALEKHPAMNATFVALDGKPHRKPQADINLGLAVDIERRGERMLMVPTIKGAQALGFLDFVARHDDLVGRARAGRLNVDDLTGATVTLTNPGTIGTALSVPRLMAGQGFILGTGRIDYPAEYAAMAPEVISELGLSKVMMVTSTYDHRIIQGAESGSLLADLERLLLGEEGFYTRLFAELGVPQEPLAWAPDRYPAFAAHDGTEAITKQASVLQLIRAYRVRGHMRADLNPLGYFPQPQEELELATHGLSVWDLDRSFVTGGLAGAGRIATLRHILDTMRNTYTRHIGVEFMHIPEHRTRVWLQQRMEESRNTAPLSSEERYRILDRLNAAEAFERFLHTTYIGHKRFSLEGAETLIPMLDTLLDEAAAAGVEEAVLGMAHRGRLNVLANVIGKSVGDIFREFEGYLDPALSHGSGDVKYHLGASGEYEAPSGRRVRLALVSNPSHLEAVDPVVEGMTRARQDRLGLVEEERGRVLPVLIHGDAAFSGQGVAAETLAMSQLPGYRTGGTVHIVINNQIGFTAGPEHTRSSQYATDVGRMVMAPIFHVNGDHPEDAVRVVKLALAYRMTFHRDVVIDLICYRRWGHNEADEPSFTNPTMYAQIDKHRSVRKLYTEYLLRRGEIDPASGERALEDFRKRLREAHDEVRRAQEAGEAGRPMAATAPQAEDGGPAVKSAADGEALERVLAALDRLPEGFQPHPKLGKWLAQRSRRFAAGTIDWALAEALAFGTLVLEGTPVRIAGEDTGRGTFSQRHAILHDFATGAPYIQLQHVAADQAPFRVYDSLLSEFAALGFEYGYSVNSPDALVLWEAQFGDFANGAQVIIDQFVASAEEKWDQHNGVVLLLPHGYEGQGPDHSSARIERFLQLCARSNMRVAVPTTPAQYFHLLRTQARLRPRRPLVVATTKSLLRHPEVIAGPAELTQGRFETVLEDAGAPEPGAAGRVLLSSGKVYYDLRAALRKAERRDVVLLRVEQLYPFPGERIAGLLRRYERVADVRWVQEEPQNMGAWRFAREALLPLLAPGQSLRYVGRAESPSPATGSHKQHVAEQETLVAEALE